MSVPARESEFAPRYAPPATRAATEVPNDAAPAAPADVPPETTPTFELEMLVSGAALVGLIQLLGASDGWLRAAMAVDGQSRLVLSLFVLMVKILLYALSGTFIIHLTVRAYWVGLVGLDSVFPGGPRWDRLKMSGPYRRAELARTVAPPRAVAARVDNVASALFSAGFLLALLALPLAVFGVPALGLGIVAERVTGGRIGVMTVYYAAVPVLFAIVALPVWVDRLLGQRIDPSTALGRVFARWVHIATTLGGCGSLARSTSRS